MIEQCVIYREQVLILVGAVIIIAQMAIYYFERRSTRRMLQKILTPPNIEQWSEDRH